METAVEGVNTVASSDPLHLKHTTGSPVVLIDADKLGFFSASPIAKPAVAGSHGGNNALVSLLSALSSLGIVDTSGVTA